MYATVEQRRIRYLVVVLLAVTINVVDSVVIRSVADPGKRIFVAGAASLDVVLVVSAIYYWLLVRPGIRGRGSLIAVVLAGAVHATYFYPGARAAAASIAGLCEAGLIGFVVVHLRRTSRRRGAHGIETDPVDALRLSLQTVVPAPGVARALALELTILYYALFAWRAKPHVPPEAQAFSLHQRGGQADLLYVAAGASLMEILPVHLLVAHWSPAWAWFATGLSLYGMIWLVGLARSLAMRPVLVGPDYLDLRYGLLFRLRVPRELIASVQNARPGESNSVIVPRKSDPNVSVELRRPMQAEGLLRTRKTVTRVAIAADDAPGCQQALARLLE